MEEENKNNVENTEYSTNDMRGNGKSKNPMKKLYNKLGKVKFIILLCIILAVTIVPVGYFIYDSTTTEVNKGTSSDEHDEYEIIEDDEHKSKQTDDDNRDSPRKDEYKEPEDAVKIDLNNIDMSKKLPGSKLDLIPLKELNESSEMIPINNNYVSYSFKNDVFKLDIKPDEEDSESKNVSVKYNNIKKAYAFVQNCEPYSDLLLFTDKDTYFIDTSDFLLFDDVSAEPVKINDSAEESPAVILPKKLPYKSFYSFIYSPASWCNIGVLGSNDDGFFYDIYNNKKINSNLEYYYIDDYVEIATNRNVINNSSLQIKLAVLDKEKKNLEYVIDSNNIMYGFTIGEDQVFSKVYDKKVKNVYYKEKDSSLYVQFEDDSYFKKLNFGKFQIDM